MCLCLCLCVLQRAVGCERPEARECLVQVVEVDVGVEEAVTVFKGVCVCWRCVC